MKSRVSRSCRADAGMIGVQRWLFPVAPRGLRKRFLPAPPPLSQRPHARIGGHRRGATAHTPCARAAPSVGPAPPPLSQGPTHASGAAAAAQPPTRRALARCPRSGPRPYPSHSGSTHTSGAAAAAQPPTRRARARRGRWGVRSHPSHSCPTHTSGACAASQPRTRVARAPFRSLFSATPPHAHRSHALSGRRRRGSPLHGHSLLESPGVGCPHPAALPLLRTPTCGVTSSLLLPCAAAFVLPVLEGHPLAWVVLWVSCCTAARTPRRTLRRGDPRTRVACSPPGCSASQRRRRSPCLRTLPCLRTPPCVRTSYYPRLDYDPSSSCHPRLA